MKPLLRNICLAAALALVSVVAVAQTAPTKSLYDRLGGKEAISAVVDKAIGYIAADERIASYFQTTIAENRVQHLHDQLTNQIAEIAGGPVEYDGLNMKKAHKGMGITSEAFDALVEDFVKAFNDFKIPQQEQNELLAALGPMRKQMVGK
jgi:hemoglobin